jgi:hypothetical protein
MQPFFNGSAMTHAHRREIDELYQAARDPAKRAEVLATADRNYAAKSSPFWPRIHRRRRIRTSLHGLGHLARIPQQL